MLLCNATGIGTDIFEFDSVKACAILTGCLALIPVKECLWCGWVLVFRGHHCLNCYVDLQSVWFQGDLWFRAIGKDLTLNFNALSLMKEHR